MRGRRSRTFIKSGASISEHVGTLGTECAAGGAMVFVAIYGYIICDVTCFFSDVTADSVDDFAIVGMLSRSCLIINVTVRAVSNLFHIVDIFCIYLTSSNFLFMNCR